MKSSVTHHDPTEGLVAALGLTGQLVQKIVIIAEAQSPCKVVVTMFAKDEHGLAMIDDQTGEIATVVKRYKLMGVEE